MKNLIVNKYIKNLLGLFFVMVFLFTRSFMGIYVFGYRIGELAILSTMLVLILYIVNLRKDKIFDNFKDTNFDKLIILILTSFMIIGVYSGSSFLNPYTYKASSYIWSLGFFFLGYMIFEKYNLNRYYVLLFLPILIYMYFLAIYDLPYSIQEFILSISDKYEPHKGSDILLMFVVIFFVFIRINENKRAALEIFILFSALYLPLLLYKSRGAFIALGIYFLIELFNLRKDLLNSNFYRNIALLIITLLVAIQSIFLVTRSGVIKIYETEAKVSQVVKHRAPELRPNEYVNYLFIRDNRFYSTDVNINWRIQIWQDVFRDIAEENLYLFGHGYSEKIPAMSALDHEGNSVRSGLDGMNENVHNYVVNLYARGGIMHILLFALFYFSLIRKHKADTGSYSSLILIIPVMFASFFDASMENSHFPLIFYFTLGMILHEKKLFAKN